MEHRHQTLTLNHIDNKTFFQRHEQLMRTTFSKDEIERFYARFDPLLIPTLRQATGSG